MTIVLLYLFFLVFSEVYLVIPSLPWEVVGCQSFTRPEVLHIFVILSLAVSNLKSFLIEFIMQTLLRVKYSFILFVFFLALALILKIQKFSSCHNVRMFPTLDFQALCNAYGGEAYGSTDFDMLEKVRDAILRMTYYW